MTLPRWKKLRRIFEIRNPWWSYRKDEFIMETGGTGEYHGVHSEGSSMIVPVDGAGRILMVNQYRYLNDRESIEFPCGSVRPGSDYDATAALELAEETGTEASSISAAGEFNPCNGVTDEICRVYVARGLSPRRAQKDPTEEFELHAVTPQELEERIASGEIWDGMTLAAWSIVRSHVLPRLAAALLLMSVTACSQKVRTGAEVLLEQRLALLSGKRVGVICNHTSVLSDGTHLVDALLKNDVNVTALFGPEHGIRGTAAAGKTIGDATDPATGLPVYSLYGKTTKPTAAMLSGVDVLLFDIQDIGARYYTYAGTMAFAMEAAAQNGKSFVVLDRPNPVNGAQVEGPVLDLGFRSLIGMFPVPTRHGLTAGELAKMIIGEGWIDDTRLDLDVVEMEGWKRSMWYDQTGLRWIPPSPNMRTLAAATVYPGTCLIEATNLSEGRGTAKPFEYIGAPGVDGAAAAETLNALGLPGVKFRPVTFTPAAGSDAGPNPKHKDKKCGGVALEVTDRSTFRPVMTGLSIIGVFRRLEPRKFEVRDGLMDRLLGSDIVRTRLNEGTPAGELLRLNAADFDNYMKMRKTYLLYPE